MFVWSVGIAQRTHFATDSFHGFAGYVSSRAALIARPCLRCARAGGRGARGAGFLTSTDVNLLVRRVTEHGDVVVI